MFEHGHCSISLRSRSRRLPEDKIVIDLSSGILYPWEIILKIFTDFIRQDQKTSCSSSKPCYTDLYSLVYLLINNRT